MTTVQMIASAGQYLAGQQYAVEDRRARHLAATGYARIVEPSKAADNTVTGDAKSRRREGRG